MTLEYSVKKQSQLLARTKLALAREKIKKRKADTRAKIELGGLVIKSGMNIHSKATILGALAYAQNLLENDEGYLSHFNLIGEMLFIEKR